MLRDGGCTELRTLIELIAVYCSICARNIFQYQSVQDNPFVKDTMKRIRISWTGIAFLLTYVVLSIVCIIKAQNTIDPKGKYIYLHFPITLQGSVLYAFGLTFLLRGMSWVEKYLYLGTPMMIILYMIGSYIESSSTRSGGEK